MARHLKTFETLQDFNDNQGMLVAPWVAYIKDVNNGAGTEEGIEDEVRYNQVKLTIAECIELGYFNSPVLTEGWYYLITTKTTFPYSMSVITDFVDVFFGNNDLSGNTASNPYTFSLGDKGHLDTSQQTWIVNRLSGTLINRHLATFKLRNFTLPNKDLIIEQSSECEEYYQYSHDMLSGSTFNNVTIGVRGNISSAFHLFKGLTCNQLEFKVFGTTDGTHRVRPYINKAEMYQNATITVMPRNISYYEGSSNWLFSGLNFKGTEIPNVGGVETEEDRVSNIYNEITLNGGTQYQVAQYLDTVERIGPVFNAIRCSEYEYIWGRNAITLLNATDVRFKNLNNINYDFRGGNVNTAQVPKMDLDSIKYAVENVRNQTEWTYTNHRCTSTADAGFSVSANNYHLIYHNPILRVDNNDGHSAVMFEGSKFKATIPSGFKLILTGYKKNGNSYYATGEEVTITGNDAEQTAVFSNSASTYVVIMIAKTDGSTITPSDMLSKTITISRVTSTADDGTETYSNYYIPNNTHTCTFSDSVYTASEVKNYLGTTVLQTAKNKGWTIYVGSTELTV